MSKATKSTIRTCSQGHSFHKSSECPSCPICEAERKPNSGFLSLLAAPARRALENKGIGSLKKLSRFTEGEILLLHGMGKASLPILNKELIKAGLAFKPEKKAITESKEFEWLRKNCISFDSVTEEPHFEKSSFRFRKKIFATYDRKANRACLKLSITEQDLFSIASRAVYAVPNKWGKQGWTFVDLKSIDKKLVTAMLKSAYLSVSGK